MINLILLLLAEIGLLFVAFLFCNRDVISPSVVVMSTFILATVCALLNVEAWNIDYGIETLIVLISGLMCFVMVEIFWVIISNRIIYKRNSMIHIQAEVQPRQRIGQAYHIENWKINLLIIYCIICLLLQFKDEIRIAKTVGYIGIGNFITYYRNAAILIAQYAEQQINPILRQLLKVLTVSGYVCLYFFVNNVFICKEKVKNNMKYLFIAVAAMIKSFMGAVRLDVLKLFIFAILIFYILKKRQMGEGWKINIKIVFKLFIGIILFIIFFYIAAGAVGRTTHVGKTFFQYITWYIGGSIECFDVYIKQKLDLSHTWGRETFAGLQSFLWRLGLTTNVDGRTNLDFVRSGTLRANVYTFFRRPLQDFGFGGMLIFTALVSSLFSVMYYMKIRLFKNKSRISEDVYIIIYGYLFPWIVFAFFDNLSFSILTPSLPVIFLMIYFIYWFLITPIHIKI